MVWNVFYYDKEQEKFIIKNIITDELIEKVRYALKHSKTFDYVQRLIRNYFLTDYFDKPEYVFNMSKDDNENKEEMDVWFQIMINLETITEFMIRRIAPKRSLKFQKLR